MPATITIQHMLTASQLSVFSQSGPGGQGGNGGAAGSGANAAGNIVIRVPSHADVAKVAVLPVGHQPGGEDERLAGQSAYIDAAHRVHARAEDAVRTGKDAGLGHFP